MGHIFYPSHREIFLQGIPTNFFFSAMIVREAAGGAERKAPRVPFGRRKRAGRPKKKKNSETETSSRY